MSGEQKAFSVFLRGGQIVLHNLRMFVQISGFMTLSALVVALVVAIVGTGMTTDPLQRHYAFVTYKAQVLGSFRDRFETRISVRTAIGEQRELSLSQILANPQIRDREQAFRGEVTRWAARGVAAAAMAALAMLGLFLQRGERLTATAARRGASLVGTPELRRRIRAFNRKRKRDRAFRGLREYRLAGIPYPLGSETQHTLISGTVGTGKTQSISDLLRQIRAAGDRAVVFDTTGGFVSTLYRPGHDVILNPMDRRAPAWSIFSDARFKSDFDAVAEALVPPSHSDPIWSASARVLFSTVAQLLAGDGRGTNEELINVLMSSSLEDLERFLAGTPAASSVSADSPRMANGVRMTLNTYIECLNNLPSDGEPFSIRDWVQDDEGDATLFLSSRPDIHTALKPLLTVWMDTAVRELLSRPRDGSRRVWFVLDEIAALHRLPSLSDGLARGRQFGAAFVLGAQAFSQLRETYGRDGAQTLSSVCRTKLVLAAPDPESARWHADFLGRQEHSRSQENYSFGANTIRDGVSLQRQDRIEHIVMPEEIMNLPSMQGFLKMAEGFPAASVRLSLVVVPETEEAFLPREGSSDLVRRRRLPEDGQPRPGPGRAPERSRAASSEHARTPETVGGPCGPNVDAAIPSAAPPMVEREEEQVVAAHDLGFRPRGGVDGFGS